MPKCENVTFRVFQSSNDVTQTPMIDCRFFKLAFELK